MKAGDRVYAPPGHELSLDDWVLVTVERIDRHRLIRDPTEAGDHRPHQWIHVVYDDGRREKYDRYFLARRNQFEE